MSQDRTWGALGDVGRRIDEDLVVEASGVSRATVRRHLRIRELAGYVRIHRCPALAARRIEKLRGAELPYIYRDGRPPAVRRIRP